MTEPAAVAILEPGRPAFVEIVVPGPAGPAGPVDRLYTDGQVAALIGSAPPDRNNLGKLSAALDAVAAEAEARAVAISLLLG